MTKRSAGGRAWQLQEAKAKFSQVFDLARTRGPQRVTRRGKEGVVVVAAEEFDRVSGRTTGESLVQFFRRSPLVGSGIKLERVRDYGRDLKL